VVISYEAFIKIKEKPDPGTWPLILGLVFTFIFPIFSFEALVNGDDSGFCGFILIGVALLSFGAILSLTHSNEFKKATQNLANVAGIPKKIAYPFFSLQAADKRIDSLVLQKYPFLSESKENSNKSKPRKIVLSQHEEEPIRNIMPDTDNLEGKKPKFGIRVVGAAILVVGFWMVQNISEIAFEGFGGQSIGPLIILVVPIAFGLPLLPILIGTRFLFFMREGISDGGGSKQGGVPYKTILTGIGIFTVFIALTVLGGESRAGWHTADGEVLESDIQELNLCDTECWQLTVTIEFKWEGYYTSVYYTETFTSITEAEKTENRINNMEHIVVEFDPANIEVYSYFPELEQKQSFYIDIYGVAGVFSVLALGLGVRDARRSKNSHVSYEDE
jgi:hypothetical protein